MALPEFEMCRGRQQKSAPLKGRSISVRPFSKKKSINASIGGISYKIHVFLKYGFQGNSLHPASVKCEKKILLSLHHQSRVNQHLLCMCTKSPNYTDTYHG